MSIDGLGRGLSVPFGLPIELHEDVVPDLHESIAVAGRTETDRLRTVQVRAAEVMDLGAAAAGARVAHLPEVVRRPQFDDPIGRHEIQPSRVCIVVARDAGLALEDRHEEPIGRQAPDAGQQLPGELNGVVLEVIAEREVAEHLEERVVPERRPDVVEIVVLAADPHAFLRGRRPAVLALLASEKQVLELVHPGVGEEQRGIVVRHERPAGHDAMALRLEVLEKRATELRRGHNL